MGDVVQFPACARPGQPDTRAIAANQLRAVIKERRRFVPGEADVVAAKVDSFIDRHAAALGRGGVTEICARIWQNRDNPGRRRDDLRKAKKPMKLMEYVERIAWATGASEDDMLLEAFGDTSLEREVTARQQGKGPEPELEAFWATLSDSLRALAGAVVRAEGLEAHTERLVALHGSYDLAADAIRPTSQGRLLDRPLANWNNHWSEFPPIPSIVLFTEPKSVTVERGLTIRDTGRVIPVRMTVLREVRLAIGPADSPLVPAPLFEFRSVLHLVGPAGALPIRCPWLYLDEDEVEVEIDGAWHMADIPFAGADLEDIPEAHPPEFDSGRWRFPARLELPLQYEHSYIVWRPVTADTCRGLLLRPRFEVTLGMFQAEPADRKPETFCPPGTLAEAIEAALHVDGPDGIPMRLRAEAARIAALVRGWHAERAAAAEAVHRDLRARWEEWT